MNWFWYFFIYSMMGCGLEIVFARAVRARTDRKRAYLLPLCPVYGVGACLCLLVAPLTRDYPGALFLTGALVCTATEYLTALWYERALRVRFWDYSGQRGNLWGRVCLPYSAAWGALVLCLVYWIHPFVSAAVTRIPDAFTLVMIPLTLADLTVSGAALRRTRDRACLRWYERIQ